MFLSELMQLDVSRMSSEERWALMEIAEKAANYQVADRAVFNNPKHSRAFVHAKLAGLQQEVFLVIFMNTQNELIACEKMFYGTVDSCAVHPREVVKKALDLNAASVILAHNHPSGHPEPSAADFRITARLKDALNLVEIRLLDHLIVGEGRQESIVSLAERGHI